MKSQYFFLIYKLVVIKIPCIIYADILLFSMKRLNEIIGIGAGAALFIVWMKLVGNPHVIETVIGIVLALAFGGFVYKKVKKS